MDKIKILVNELDDLGYNPIEIENMIKTRLENELSNLKENKYTTIIFDSPVGIDSEIKLRHKDYSVKWVGKLGHRGQTFVFIPKSNKSFKTDEFKKMLKNEELIDDYTTMIVK